MIQRKNFLKVGPHTAWFVLLLFVCLALGLDVTTMGWMSQPWPGEGSLDKGPAADFPLPGLRVKAIGLGKHIRCDFVGEF